MASINTVINNISNQNISLFFENKITSFKPEREVFANTVNADTPYADPIKIGYAELKNHEELLVFTCEYNKELTARSAKKKQFEIAKKVLKEDFKDGAIFIFYDAQGNFRFSFIRRNYGQAGDKKFSTWKRFTYYVTPSETNRTFIERIDKCDYSSLDSIQEAFSVEKLTKQFYNELFAWYQWALSNEIGITYPNNTKTSDDDRVKLEEQVIRLITRLLFVWFIKQKKLVPEYLFDTNELEKSLIDFDGNSKVEGNYYNAILQNLFFATLNKEIAEREFAKTKDRDIKTRYRYEEMFALSESEIINYFKPIPFLNGGLFECLDKQDTDGNQYFLDGFSRNPTKAANGNFKHRAFIPNCLFFDEEKGIIPLLKRYNFTVEENAPNEVQVALDPELLGKVFENLLGAFNPETKETARKQSGSFYTPREIVEYMVNESLINYLQTKLPNLQEAEVRDLFENETPTSTLLNDSETCKAIANQLKAIKILDPACGSGAFPMGILSKMVEVLEKLGATNQSIHDLKLHLIEECIYGIDIQTIATQISKLRFFITLVVEQNNIDLTKPNDNYGVLTLPNLETKFVSANTLIGIKKKKAGDFVSTLFTDSAIDDTKQQLLNIRHEHFYAKTAGAKKRLREQDALLRDKLAKLLEENKDFAPDDALQLSQWNPYDQNTSAPFFDMEWMFGIKNGFDVVIGNPPYIGHKGGQKKLFRLLKTHTLGRMYNNERMDIFYYFFHQSINFASKDGLITFITTNYFLTADSAIKLRKDFYHRAMPIKLVNFSELKVFESAIGQHNIITILSKASSKDKCEIVNVNRDGMATKDILHDILYNKDSLTTYYLSKQKDLFDGQNRYIRIIDSNNDNIIKTKKLLDKLSKSGNRLGNEFVISQGIVTGIDKVSPKHIRKFPDFKKDINNGVFIITNDEKSKIGNSELLKPWFKNSDISKYKVNTECDKYLVHTSVNIDLQHYPNINKHLNYYKKIITNRNYESGELSKAKRLNKWYALSSSRWDFDFDKPKIVSPQRSYENTFAFTDKSWYASADVYAITTENEDILSLKYLLGILNSKLIYFWLYNRGKRKGQMLELYLTPLSEIPIIIDRGKKFKQIIYLVDKIIGYRELDIETNSLEFNIDTLVYKIYDLTHQEVLIIDPEFSLTKEEYDNYKIE